jgi:hypothetical protein
LKLEFSYVAVGRSRQSVEHLEATAEVRDGFQIGGRSHRFLGSPNAIVDGSFSKSGGGAMVRKQSGISCYYFWKIKLDARDNTGMDLLTPAPQQRAVGRVLHQRVFESVFRVGWRPAPVN